MRIKDYTDTIRHLTDPFNIPEARRMIAENPALTQEQFKAGGIVEPGVVHYDSRVGYRTGKTIRGSTIAMQEPVEFYVDIIRKMVSDNKYVPPVNINPREVGKIPNFLKAKELVKAETGESFDVLYNRNIQKRKKIKRALDPKKKEMDLISMAERKGRRRALKVDPSDPVKITDRERAINFEQRKYNKNLNLKIRQNSDIILKDKALMDKLSTTISKEGNIIKVKPTLDDIKNRGIIEVEHQRDIFKKGKLKDLPYNRNFILGPYNREGGFKKMAETFIEKNPDANNVKVKNIIKKAEELGVTLQPDVPKGTFLTKSVGYKQIGGPVEKFASAAAHSFKGSTFESKINLLEKKSVAKILSDNGFKCKLQGGLTCNNPKAYIKSINEQKALALAGDANAAAKFNKVSKAANAARGISKFTLWGILGEVAFAPVIALPMLAKGESWSRIMNDISWGAFGESEQEELERVVGTAGTAQMKTLKTSERAQKLQEKTFPGARIGMDLKRFDLSQYQVKEAAEQDFRDAIKPFMADGVFDYEAFTRAGGDVEAARAQIAKDKLARKESSIFFQDKLDPTEEMVGFDAGGRVSYLDGGIVSLLKK